MSVEPVWLDPGALAAIRAEAARAYPNEGCGALLGNGEDEVLEALPLRNGEQRQPRTRFSVAPRDYLAAESLAEARGLRLLGFWHSHPDHPARPSATDRRFAWEELLTLIVAVEAGVPGALTAWELTRPGKPFRERPIVVLERQPMSRV